MKKNRVLSKFAFCLCIILITVISITVSYCGGLPAGNSDIQQTLTVAPYTDVPDLEAFKKEISQEWHEMHPNIKLKFVDWSCYDGTLPSTVDVFVFDSMYYSKYRANNILAEIPADKIKDKKDYLSFTLKDISENGNYYGVPQLICTDVLISRKDDTAIDQIDSMDELYKKLGTCTSDNYELPENHGLYINLGMESIFTTYYLEGIMDQNDRYTSFQVMPNINKLDNEVSSDLKSIVDMAGEKQAYYDFSDGNSYIKADWFKKGSGRVLYGFTENLSHLTDSTVSCQNIQKYYNVKKISMDTGEMVPVFYTDYIGINERLNNTGKMSYALDLVDLMADNDTLEGIIRKSNNECQFLLSARKSVYTELQKDFPIYKKLYSIANNKNNHVFLLGKDFPSFYDQMGNLLPQL